MNRNLSRLLLLTVISAGAGLAVWQLGGNPPKTAPQQQAAMPPAKKQTPRLPVIEVQPVLDNWNASQTGKASVVVYDLENKKTVGSLLPDEQYFTASIYKLYVAYFGYQKIADGTHDFNQPYVSGYSRGQCLDAMIRSSFSPCAEKMWVELGKQNLTDRLRAYGLTDTSLVGLYTSAKDAALILQRLFERRDLGEDHTSLFLESLKTQDPKYRKGLPQGFQNSTVYNKVGYNGQVEYHDAAIVSLKNGRHYAVTILTERIGTNNIIALSKAIEATLSR